MSRSILRKSGSAQENTKHAHFDARASRAASAPPEAVHTDLARYARGGTPGHALFVAQLLVKRRSGVERVKKNIAWRGSAQSLFTSHACLEPGL